MSYIDDYNNSSNNKIPYDSIPISRNDRASRYSKKTSANTRVFAILLTISLLVNIALCISTIYFFKNGISKYIEVNNNTFTTSTSISPLAVSNARWSSVCVTAYENKLADSIDINTFFSGPSSGYRSQGAGAILSLDKDAAYFITCYHVISNLNYVYVLAPSSRTAKRVDVVGSSSDYDVAVLKTNKVDFLDGCRPITTYNSNNTSVGEAVFAIGNPANVGLSVSSGLISQLNVSVSVNGRPALEFQTSADINPGNSGGGLFNEFGEYIGLVNAKKETNDSSSKEDLDGVAYAIPGNLAVNIAKNIIQNGGKAKKLNLGLSLKHGDIITSEQMDFDGRIKPIDINDVIVSNIDENSPLHNKIRNDDVITRVAYTDQFNKGSTFDSPVRIFNRYILDELSFAVAPNSSITIYYRHGRDEEERSVQIIVTDKNFVNVK